MRPVIFSIGALLLSACLLQLGNGLQLTLLPLRADEEGFAAFVIAGLGSGYFAGFLAGCVFGPVLIGRVGHIRVMAGMIAVTAAVVAAYALMAAPPLWILGRAANGFCLAVAYMAIESWLNERAPHEQRGTLLSIYSLSGMAMLAGGQLLLNLYPVAGFQLFSVAAILIVLAAVPVTLTRAPAPVVLPQPRLQLRSLLAVSRAAVIGAVAVGLTNSAFWALGPVFAARLGLDTAAISLFMATALGGGALTMWPLGAMSDRVDRRSVAAVAALGAAAAALGLVWLGGQSPLGLLICAYFFGAFAFTLYPVCVAHANDHAAAGEFVTVSGGLLFLFGASSLVGPVAGAVVIALLGSDALFLFTAAIHGAAGVAILILQRTRPAALDWQKEAYQVSPRTTQAAYQMQSDQEWVDEKPPAAAAQ